MPIYVNEQGVPSSFSTPEEMARAEAEGWKLRDEQVNVVDPLLDRPFAYGQEAVPEQLERGGFVEPTAAGAGRLREQLVDEEYGGFGGGLAAGAAGLARGLTLGGSDVLLREAGVDTRDLKLLQEENPGLSAAGEIGGAIGTSVLTGGLGTAGLAGRGLGGAVTAGALEGAAFGAAQGVSKAVINDIPLFSQAGLAEIGTSALLGGGAGGVAGGLIHGAGKLAEGLKGKRLIAEADEAAELSADVVTPQNLADVERRLGQDAHKVTTALHSTADDLLETSARIAQGSPVRGSNEQLREWAVQRQSTLMESATEVLSQARTLQLGGKATAEINKAIKESTRLTRAVLKPGMKVNSNSFAPVEAKLHKLEGAITKLAKRVDAKAGNALKKGESPTWEAIARKLDDLDNGYHAQHGTGVVQNRLGQATSVPIKANPELGKMAAAGQELRSAFQADWGLSGKDILSEAAIKRFTRAVPEEQIRMASSLGGYMEHLKQMAAQMPHTPFTKQLDDLALDMRLMLNKAAPGDPGKPAAEIMRELAMSGGLVTGSQSIPDVPGPVDDWIRWGLTSAAAGKSGKALIAGGGTKGLGSRAKGLGVSYLANRGAAKLAQAGGGGFAGFALRTQGAALGRSAIEKVLGGTQGLSRVAGKSLARINLATENILKGVSKAKRGGPVGAATVLNKVRFAVSDDDDSDDDLHTAFRKRSQELSNAVANKMATHQMLYDALTPVRQIHPELADAMEMQAMSNLEYAYNEMPKDPGVVKTLGKSRWRPSESEAYQWANVLEALDNPIGEVEKVAAGTITPQGAKVLRTQFPRLYQEVQTYLVANLDKLQENSDYDQRGRLSILFGVPVDSSRTPEFGKFNTQFWADRAAAEEPMDPGNFQPNEPSEAQKLIA